MPLSVASALARLGTDPWAEAERLAKLPRDRAAEVLAAVVLRTFPARVKPRDAREIAARLILLLPIGVPSPAPGQTGSAGLPQGWSNKLVLLACLALLAFASFNLLVDETPPSDAPHAVSSPPTP